MLNEQTLRYIVPTAPKDVAKFIPFINNAFIKYGIDKPSYQAAFIAQIAHESGSFNYVKEIASGRAYDTGAKAISLGNTPEADGDGQRYKGRGLIQITGKNNYRSCSRGLFGSEILLTKPELLETPQYAVESAAWFWLNGNLNRYVDKNDFIGLTKRINGGTNGLKERLLFWERAKGVIR